MNDESLHIRAATSWDLDAIWGLWKIIMDQKIYYPYDSSYSRANIEESWINLDNHTYVAEMQGKMVGAYIFKANQPGYGKHIANAAYMVDTSFRGRGIGYQLCAHSVVQAKAAGFRGMQFNLVVSTNIAGIRAWKANGFEIIGTIPGGFYHVEKGYVDAYIFYKDLVG